MGHVRKRDVVDEQRPAGEQASVLVALDRGAKVSAGAPRTICGSSTFGVPSPRTPPLPRKPGRAGGGAGEGRDADHARIIAVVVATNIRSGRGCRNSRSRPMGRQAASRCSSKASTSLRRSRKQAECISTMTHNEDWQVVDAGFKLSQLVVFKYEDEGVATIEGGL